MFKFLQLNQQSQAKGGTTQDLSFLKEASPIYVTSLSNNTVSVTNTSTTVTAGTKVNYSAGSSLQQVATNNNNTVKPIGNVPTTTTTTATNLVAGSAATKSAQNVINFNAGVKPNTNQIQSTAPQSSNTSLYSNVPPSTSRQQTTSSVSPGIVTPSVASSSTFRATPFTVAGATHSSLATPKTNEQQQFNLNNNNNSINNNIINVNHSLINNNINSNISKTGAGNSSCNSYYSNLTNTIIANGHGPKREVI